MCQPTMTGIGKCGYARFLTRSGEWFEEYRNHWLWLIVAFFGGAIGTKLVEFIVAREKEICGR